MIVIDTSALVAILNREPERIAFFEVIAAADRCLVSAVTYQEAGHVLIAKRGINGLYDLEELSCPHQGRDCPARHPSRRFRP
jgi:ribonuclease VapC